MGSTCTELAGIDYHVDYQQFEHHQCIVCQSHPLLDACVLFVQVSMAIEPFLDVYDVDYQRYKTLQEWNAPAELVPDLARLKYYYGTHCIREQTGPIQAS